MSKGDRVVSAASGDEWEVLELGLLAPERHATPHLRTGQVGYVITGVKDLKAARVGDTWMRSGDKVLRLILLGALPSAAEGGAGKPALGPPCRPPQSE